MNRDAELVLEASSHPKTYDTQGPPAACDSPSSVPSGRNRENSVPLRVTQQDQNKIPTKAPFDQVN
jgi:hypothetical protein